MAPAFAFQSPVAETPGQDWTCASGAAQLKNRIEAYWRSRGYEVQVMLVDGPFSAALRATRVDVRSELVNGLPRAALKPISNNAA